MAKQALMPLVNTKLATESESMRATEVNAMHIYEENLVFMSAAILQPPFFDIKQPASVQYGAIGFIIGKVLQL
jgi:predicted metalloendopeptidase